MDSELNEARASTYKRSILRSMIVRVTPILAWQILRTNVLKDARFAPQNELSFSLRIILKHVLLVCCFKVFCLKY
jgi:hypothetical protein